MEDLAGFVCRSLDGEIIDGMIEIHIECWGTVDACHGDNKFKYLCRIAIVML